MSERIIENEKVTLEDIGCAVAQYVFASRFVTGKVILDIACGMGYGTDFLSRQGAKIAVGADINIEAIQYAQVSYSQQNLFFLLNDAERLPFRSHLFDTVITLESIEHLHNQQNFINECKRVLKPGGTLVCSTPSRECHFFITRYLHEHKRARQFLQKAVRPLYKIAINPYHLHELTIEELVNLVNKSFTVDAIYVQSEKSFARLFTYRLANKKAVREFCKFAYFLWKKLYPYPAIKLQSLKGNLESIPYQPYTPIPLSKDTQIYRRIILVAHTLAL